MVTQVSVGHAWLNLRDSLESAATAWYLAELADRSLEERHAAELLYALLRRAYELLDAGMAPGRVARWYEMHLLDELGVRPEVDRCVECDRVLDAGERFRWCRRSVASCASGVPARPTTAPACRSRRSAASRPISASISRPSPSCASPSRSSVRSRPCYAISCAVRWSAEARSLAFLDEVRTAPIGAARRSLATKATAVGPGPAVPPPAAVPTV